MAAPFAPASHYGGKKLDIAPAGQVSGDWGDSKPSVPVDGHGPNLRTEVLSGEKTVWTGPPPGDRTNRRRRVLGEPGVPGLAAAGGQTGHEKLI